MTDRPADRYGGRRRPRRFGRRIVIVGLTLLIAVVALGVATVAFWRLGTADVRGELGGYRLLDGETVEVTVTVTRRDPAQPVVCIVRARSRDGAETGRREVLVPPSATATVHVTTEVKSTRPPVIGDVYGCGTDVPGYLRAP